MALDFKPVSSVYVQCALCGKLVLKRLTYLHDCRAFKTRHQSFLDEVADMARQKKRNHLQVVA